MIVGSPTGTSTRSLCAECGDRFTGAAAGMVAGGDVSRAISTAGWFSSMRKWRRTSNDNPFSESWFKSREFAPKFPRRLSTSTDPKILALPSAA